MTDGADTARAVRVFISYSHDSDEHRANVLRLAQELRRAGVDAWIDQFIEAEPPLSWPLWMTEQIEHANFVLVVVTETYARRFMGRESIGRGLGVRWEGAIITDALYHAVSDRVKFIPILVSPGDSVYIPPPLSLTTRYDIGLIDDRHLEPLLRHLLNQPAVVPEPIGPVTTLERVGSARETREFQSAIAAALARAKQGDRDGARADLEALLDGVPKEIAALAAYNLGLLWQEEEA